MDYKFELLRTIHTGIVAVAEWYNFRIPTCMDANTESWIMVDDWGHCASGQAFGLIFAIQKQA